MDWLGEFWRRLSFLWNGRRIDRDLEEEMRFHLDMKARAAAESGSPAPDAESEARRATHLQFGGATLWREIARDAWGWGVVRLVLRDAILMIAAGMAIGAGGDRRREVHPEPALRTAAGGPAHAGARLPGSGGRRLAGGLPAGTARIASEPSDGIAV